MIITFYSFKGGVGRSMAVANIGELFYARGLKVLMVDFDLEAPGLERYFDVTNSATVSREIPGHRGVIDVILSFLELQRFAPKLAPVASSDATSEPVFPFSVEPLSSFIVPRHLNNLCLRPEFPNEMGVPPALPGIVSRRRKVVVLYERWRKALRSRLVGGGFKQP